jgi:hypothetical protein
MSTHSDDYILCLRDGLAEVDIQTKTICERYGFQPAAGSVAHNQLETSPRRETIATAITLPQVLIDFGVEHLSVLNKTLLEPIEVLALATCARSMLEACAIAAWVADPAVDARERIARVFAHRYEGLTQKVSLTRAIDDQSGEVAKFESDIDAVEKDAIEIGYSPILSKKSKRIGIAMKTPDASSLIDDVLGEKPLYKYLSAIAHGHFWAINHLGYKSHSATYRLNGDVSLQTIEKALDIDQVARIVLGTVRSFLRAVWNYGRFMGWSRSELVAMNDAIFDVFQTNHSSRFWHGQST